MDKLKKWFAEREASLREDFFQFLRFPSISAEGGPQLTQCANWLCNYLNRCGLPAQIWPTAGAPAVYASYDAGPGRPTLLFYGHYDVQPADPRELWEADPFEPQFRNGYVVARGAQDNKGQCFYVIQALRALLETEGRLPCSIRLLIEGEEEIGSPNLPPLIEAHRAELNANAIAVVDTDMAAAGKPAITVGVRGITSLELELRGSLSDLHSGLFGGLAYNPIRALVEMLGKLHRPSGRVAVPGFYKQIRSLTKRQHALLNWDSDVQAFGGETNLPPLERNWVRPTLEYNGIFGGYAGPGVKTVIPAVAGAKITCRLVPTQEPYAVQMAVAKQLEALCPDGMELTITLGDGGAPAWRTNPDSPLCRLAKQAYEEVFATPCSTLLCGGSIPIVSLLAQELTQEMVLLGVGLPDDGIHAPNERFGWDRFQQGLLSTARLCQLLK
jgi:acetylornithine deacetylase/succinyl-diaminopimelate desuccinylase-like protein